MTSHTYDYLKEHENQIFFFENIFFMMSLFDCFEKY